MKNKKDLTDRKQLITFFKKGSLPNETHFEKLIHSTFNKADDKLDIDDEDGLLIYPAEKHELRNLISFFEDKDDQFPVWVMRISKGDSGGISINNVHRDDNESKSKIPDLFIEKGRGNIGVGTNSPTQKLDVNGIIASKGRAGNYCEGELDADGKWHNVFEGEGIKGSGSNAFEVMAYAQGKKEQGRYALMHAIAISTYGNSKCKISKTRAHFGKSWNKIDIRWESRPIRLQEGAKDFDEADAKKGWWNRIVRFFEQKETFIYNLQLRTRSNYGKGKKIQYKVSVLWDDNFRTSTK
ncbi:hypothetical protein [Urechidicola croceus]|uniref:Adhesin n=1 Tax=Urechidicola croceus TaxID=1850246 RepID=A0A1D8P802_9FLAO|nr:hypothetical protein [Urechidicola croceus]AOW20704.1 hypothetical protein LPB138_08455 [Urechidicola croceus]